MKINSGNSIILVTLKHISKQNNCNFSNLKFNHFLHSESVDNNEKEVMKTIVRKNVRELHSGDYFGLYSFIAG